MTHLMGVKVDFSCVVQAHIQEPWAALGAPSHCHMAFPVLELLFQAVRGGVSVVKGAATLAFGLSCGLGTSETLSCPSTWLQSVPLQTGTFVG